jgi:serine/threonine protein kinase
VKSNEIQHSSGRQFRLLKRIGKGGFGEVYLAEMSTASGFTKTVAVKLLRTDIEQIESTSQRMRDEARLLGMLRHRSIVQADDLITLDGRTALVMEFIPGVNHSWIIHPKRYEDPIPPRVVLSIISNIADALDAAYNRPSTVTGKPLQVLHRDIKPGNVRVTPDGEVKVLDFGIARSDHMDREATTTEYQLGSLPYMAPELMAGKNASPASDIYSLGVCFYESLGRRRFGWAGEEADSQESQIKTRFADIDWEPYGDVATEVEDLLRSMLDFDPRNRPSARSVLEALRELEHKAPGLSIESWAPKALEGIKKPEDGELGDLAGKTLFEEVSTSAHDKQAFLDQLEEATLALSEDEMSAARGHAVQDEKGSGLRNLAVLFLLLLAAVGTAYVVFTQDSDLPPPTTAAQGKADLGQALPAADSIPKTDPEGTLDANSLTEKPAPELTPIPVKATPTPPPKAAPKAQVKQPAPTVPNSLPANPTQPSRLLEPIKIRISSKPFGIPVLVDGKPVGETPLSNLALTPGPHVLLFNDGERTLREEIVVKPNGKVFWTYLQAEHTVQ